MYPRRKTLIFTRLAAILMLVCLTPWAAIAEEKQSEPNKYLEMIKNERDLVLREMAESEKQSSKFLKKNKIDLEQVKRAVDESRIYNTEIASVEKRIAEGEPFGLPEYTKSMQAISQQTTRELQRASEARSAASMKKMAESDRQFAEASAASIEIRNAAIANSEERYRVETETVGLKYKFQTSKGVIGIIIWNMPIDGLLHKRFTSTVNIHLLADDNTVWSEKDIALNTTDARTAIRLPSVMFNRVVIELPTWKGLGSGLSEVEVYVGEENVAAARPCEVSSIETLPIHLDDTNSLTDGISKPTQMGEGYWIPEEKTKAMVSIHLLGKKIALPETTTPLE